MGAMKTVYALPPHVNKNIKNLRRIIMYERIKIGAKELHLQEMPEVKMNGKSGREIYYSMEEDWKIRNAFYASVKCFDNKHSWKGSPKTNESSKAFFQYVLLEFFGRTQFEYFDEAIKEAHKRFQTEKDFIFEDAMQVLIDRWNEKKELTYNGKVYSAFEIYCASAKYYDFYEPHGKFKHTYKYNAKIDYKFTKVLQHNILLHSAKWLTGNASELAIKEIIERKVDSVNNRQHGLLSDIKNQAKNLDYFLGKSVINIKSGKTLTSKFSYKIFKHTKYDFLMGPAEIEVLDEEKINNKILIGKSQKGLGYKVKIKNIMYDDFRIYDHQMQEVSLHELLQRSM